MEKTLYLSECPTLRVRRDGPSLWIEHRGRAGQRVPARLIRRVLIKGNVPLDTGSLTLFAERGIPITFLNRQGLPVAAMLGVDEHDHFRRIRQASLLGDENKQDRLHAWLAAWARGRELVLVSRLHAPCASRWRKDGYSREEYEHFIRGLIPNPTMWQAARRFLTSAVYELLLTHITAQGWDPHIGIRQIGRPFGMVWDFVDSLHAEIDAMWLHMIADSPKSTHPDQERAIAVFETTQGKLEKFTRLMLRQYGLMLLEW